jgi:5-methylcytosine-specific restriction endonuclease McrBC regulatory subunit McrC
MKSGRFIAVSEFGDFTSFRSAADSLSLPPEKIRQRIDRALISAGYEPDSSREIRGSSFRFTGICGVLALDAKHWIEIVPKFLDAKHSEWREDFLWIVGKTSYDGLNYSSTLPSSSNKNTSLYDLIARIWCDSFEENERKLIRKYRRRSWRSFNIDGELLDEWPDSTNEDGFLQRGLTLSRMNPFNSLLKAAADTLLKKVSTPQINQRLARAASKLGQCDPKFSPSKVPSLPSRNAGWANCVNLSKLVLSSSSIGYGSAGTIEMPSFLVKTHVTWELLMRLLCRTAFTESVVSKKPYRYGIRKKSESKPVEMEVTPDITVHHSNGDVRLFDAKYKTGLPGRLNSLSISNADVYESLAFMKAAECGFICLLYPSAEQVDSSRQMSISETIKVGEKTIQAALLGITCISKQNGWPALVKAFKSGCQTLACETIN